MASTSRIVENCPDKVGIGAHPPTRSVKCKCKPEQAGQRAAGVLLCCRRTMQASATTNFVYVSDGDKLAQYDYVEAGN